VVPHVCISYDMLITVTVQFTCERLDQRRRGAPDAWAAKEHAAKQLACSNTFPVPIERFRWWPIGD